LIMRDKCPPPEPSIRLSIEKNLLQNTRPPIVMSNIN